MIGLSFALSACSEDRGSKQTPTKNNLGANGPAGQNTVANATTPGAATGSGLDANATVTPSSQTVDLATTPSPSAAVDVPSAGSLDTPSAPANSDLVVTDSNSAPSAAVVETAAPPAQESVTPASQNEVPQAHSTSTPPPLQSAPAAPEEAAAPTPTSAAPKAAAQACAAPYQEMNPEWFPGLPAPAAKQPIYTDLPSKTEEGARFTDAHQDGLLAFAVDRANALPSFMQMHSRDFSKRIKNVRVGLDARTTGQVKVLIDLVEGGKTVLVDLRGQLQNFRTAKRADIKLVQLPEPGPQAARLHYAGVLTCADLTHACRNVVIRLDDLNSKNKIVMSAFLIHRWGPAHLTLSDGDRHAFAKIPNPNQSSFAELLANHLNNSCLNIVASAAKAGRALNECSKQRLFAECGNEDVKSPAIQAVGFRNWAVAYGRAGFEVSFNQTVFNGVTDKAPAQTIAGPLIWSTARPVTSKAMKVEGLGNVDHVYLMNNDGGGNLNFQIDFKGEPAAHMRMTVSSLSANAAYQQAIEHSLRAMPALPHSQTATATDQDLK